MVIAIGIIGAVIWLVHAHKESKTIKRRLHEKYIIQQNMRNQVIFGKSLGDSDVGDNILPIKI